MKAVTYQGIKNVVVKEVPDAKIEKPDDMIVKITSTAICGSDLHLIHGMIPNLQENYVIGHEPMGIVEEVGPGVTKVKKGDRVIIPFNIACGECFFAKISLKANVTTLTNTGIWAHILATPEQQADTLAGKPSIYGSRSPTLPTSRFPKTANNRTKS